MLHIRQPLSPFWALKQLSFRVVLTICTVLFLLGGLGGLRAEGIITPQLARKNKSRLCSNCEYGKFRLHPGQVDHPQAMIQNRRQSSFLVPDEDSLEDMNFVWSICFWCCCFSRQFISYRWWCNYIRGKSGEDHKNYLSQLVYSPVPALETDHQITYIRTTDCVLTSRRNTKAMWISNRLLCWSPLPMKF